MNYDIFVSYSTHDKTFADALVNRLESDGLRCWYAPRDIPPGVTWPAAITQAVRHSTVMLLVFSGSANSSQEVSKELTLASNNKRMVVPVRIENIKPSEEIEYHLTNRHWLDVYDLELEKAVTSVVNNLKSYADLFSKGAPPPPEDAPNVAVHAPKKKKSKMLPVLAGLVAALAVLYFAVLRIPALPPESALFDNKGPGSGTMTTDGINKMPRPPIGKYSRVYVGAQGVKVWLVRFGPEETKEYLITMVGIDSIWDSYTIRGIQDTARGKERYTALLKGKRHMLLTVKGDEGVFYPPDGGSGAAVKYDGELSDKYYPDYYLSQYLWQQRAR